MSDESLKSYPLPSVRRMPMYLRYLREIHEQGRTSVSCTHIADHLGLNSIQVRKDLALTEIVGRPKVGYDLVALIDAIERFLGWNNTQDAFLVGVGSLGRAFLGYDGFVECGLKIIAGFDKSPSLIGSTIHGKEILDAAMLPDLVQRMHIQIGILTVPGDVAQQLADVLIEAGMRAIWNYTPCQLTVPSSVVVEDVRMAASFAVLSTRLTDLLQNRSSVIVPDTD